jgi:hypothetical protein
MTMEAAMPVRETMQVREIMTDVRLRAIYRATMGEIARPATS